MLHRPRCGLSRCGNQPASPSGVMSRQALAPFLAAVFLLAGCGSGARVTHASQPPATGAATEPQTTSSTTTPTSAAPATPDLASCVSAWNTESSASDQQGLNGLAAQVSPDVVVATYTGPTEMVGGVGSANDIPVQSDRCLVIADSAVYVQQRDGTWQPSAANLTGNFSAFANPATAQSQANAHVSVGYGGQSGVGLLTADPGGLIVTLAAQDVNGAPASSGDSGSTGNTNNPQTTGQQLAPAGKQDCGGNVYPDSVTAKGTSCAEANNVRGAFDQCPSVQNTGSPTGCKLDVLGFACQIEKTDVTTMVCNRGTEEVTFTVGSD